MSDGRITLPLFSGDPQDAKPRSGFVTIFTADGTFKTIDENGIIRTTTGLTEILQDLVPKLGADLNLNTFDILTPDPGSIYTATKLIAQLQEVKGIADTAFSGAQPHWSFVGGISAVGANSTKNASYGHNNALAGLPMFRNGEIIGLGMQISGARTAGSVIFQTTINGVAQNGAGETIIIDGINEQVTNLLAILDLTAPIQYSASDFVEFQTVTSGFSPTGSDATLVVFFRDR